MTATKRAREKEKCQRIFTTASLVRGIRASSKRGRDGVRAAVTRAARPCRMEKTSLFGVVVSARTTCHARSRVRVRALGTRGSAKRTHRQYVVIVVAELLLGEQAQVLRARVEPQRRLHGCSSLWRTGFSRCGESPFGRAGRGAERVDRGRRPVFALEPRWRAERAPSCLTASRGPRVGRAFACPRAPRRDGR